jgi:hypothetical protein
MDIASVFDWFARDSMNAAEESDEPRQRETLLKLALQWEAAAQQSRAEASPQQSQGPRGGLCRALVQRAPYLGKRLSFDRKGSGSPATVVETSVAGIVRSAG